MVEVSVLDRSQGLQINGTEVPLFRTRSSSTTVRLQHGQSFAIAGLLQDQLENVKRAYPGLGSIPILGALFNSRQFQRSETELVVVVTARLVNPLNSASLPPLPTKKNTDPNDAGLFFMNVFEQHAKKPTRTPTPSRRAALPRGDETRAKGQTGLFDSAVGYWR